MDPGNGASCTLKPELHTRTHTHAHTWWQVMLPVWIMGEWSFPWSPLEISATSPHTHAHTYTHAHTHTHAHTCTHAHTHANTHAHTCTPHSSMDHRIQMVGPAFLNKPKNVQTQLTHTHAHTHTQWSACLSNRTGIFCKTFPINETFLGKPEFLTPTKFQNQNLLCGRSMLEIQSNFQHRQT